MPQTTKRAILRAEFKYAWGGIALCVLLSGCMQNALLRGKVNDISGQELPGVVVRVTGSSYEGLSNANGDYSFRVASGNLEIDFAKTGYAPVHMSVTVPSLGILDLEPVRLWPLPVAEGVYTFINFRYQATERPRVNRYIVKDKGFAFGTPVEPGVTIDYADPKACPEENPPRLIAHKMPAYDAHLCRLQKVKASLAQTGLLSTNDKKNEKIPYNEDIWIAAESIPLISKPLDEPERQLLELRPTQALEPGAYAIHWGALDGYDGIDHRAFLFSIVEKTSENPENEGETEADQPSGKDTAKKESKTEQKKTGKSSKKDSAT